MVLYIGVTGRGLLRIMEHIEKKVPGFTSKYNVNKLAYIEQHTEVTDAISREKQLKSGAERKKYGLLRNRIRIGRIFS